MSKHTEAIREALQAGPTPGPWFQSHRTSVYGGYQTEVYTADGEVVATVAWYPRTLNDTTTTTDREANARLIAACNPVNVAALLAERDAMAKALQTCVWALRQPLDDWKGECERKALDAANDAIRKATED